MLGNKYRATLKDEQDLIAQGYSQGEADQKAKDEAASSSSDDSSIWNTLGTIADCRTSYSKNYKFN